MWNYNLLIQNMYPNTSHQNNKMRAIYRVKFANLRCWICRVDTSDDRAATDQHICYETHEGRVELLISSKIITTECLWKQSLNQHKLDKLLKGYNWNNNSLWKWCHDEILQFLKILNQCLRHFKILKYKECSFTCLRWKISKHMAQESLSSPCLLSLDQ